MMIRGFYRIDYGTIDRSQFLKLVDDNSKVFFAKYIDLLVFTKINPTFVLL